LLPIRAHRANSSLAFIAKPSIRVRTTSYRFVSSSYRSFISHRHFSFILVVILTLSEAEWGRIPVFAFIFLFVIAHGYTSVVVFASVFALLQSLLCSAFACFRFCRCL
jgi:hypothetical protein